MQNYKTNKIEVKPTPIQLLNNTSVGKQTSKARNESLTHVNSEVDLNRVNRTGFVGDFLFKLGHLT